MKIGDFGMSRHVDMTRQQDGSSQLTRQLSSDVIGTTNYTAPELLKIFEDPENDADGQNKTMTAEGVETILKSDVYRQGLSIAPCILVVGSSHNPIDRGGGGEL